MAGKESRQCPHFDTHNGVCGCPEFWQPARHPQNDWFPSTLQEVSNMRYGQSARNSQFSSSVNSIPLTDRTETQLSTPAPPGPPKETCFFWYHGTCRRGEDCDRPHEAHPTWPIPPPPGYRHFQPCTLPLCPLRTDLEVSIKPQEYQRRRRMVGGQMDGAVFSRATAGESSSDGDSCNNNTDTDMNEANEYASIASTHEILGASTQYGVASQTLASNADEEGTYQEGEVKVQQDLGRDESDQSDYVDLSLLLSRPSTPLVQEGTLLSISHSGTLSKRRQSLLSDSLGSNNKRVKLEESDLPDLSNVVSTLERPCNMSQWDIKPPGFGLDGHHLEPRATRFAPMHSFSPQLQPAFAANNNQPTFVPQSFDPPKGPRSMGSIPPICFFFYHKGYCNPKRGRRCDYLHDMSTSQQTVSLPHGIDNHDPTCSLPLCPVRLQALGQVKQEPDSVAPSTQPKIKDEPLTPPRITKSPFSRVPDSSPRDMILSVRGKLPRGMLGQPLPQLTGIARQRFKEQKRLIEQIQARDGIDPAVAASAVRSVYQKQEEKQAKRKKKGDKKRARADAAERLRWQMEERDSIQQEVNGESDAFSMQRPLPSLSVREGTPAHAVPSTVGNPKKKRRKRRSKKPLHSQHTKELWLGDSIDDEGIRVFTPEAAQDPNPSWALLGFPSSPRAPNTSIVYGEKQASVDTALQMVNTMNQDPRKWRPLNANPQTKPSEPTVPHEYSQESLGLSAEERRAEIRKEQRARHEAFYQRQRAAHEEKAQMAASVSPDLHRQSRAGDEELGPKPRCHRCRNMKKGCDRQRPCRRCQDAGIGIEGCVDWNGASDRKVSQDEAAVAAESAAEYKLPEGGQRLDWDTDLVRRLFGEIE